jgi:hypothetical protein
MPQGQGMLRPLRSLEELQADFALADSDLDLASQLLSTEYIPNSGALGAVAMMFNAYQGKKTKKGAEAKIADLMRESSELMTRKEREELEKKAREQQAEFDRKMKAAIKAGHSEGAAYAIAEGVPLPKSQEPKVMKVGNQLVSIGADGKPQVIHEAPRAPQAGPEAPSSIRELQAYMQLSPEQREVYDRLQGRTGGGQNAPSGYRFAQDGSLEPIPGGPADPTKKVDGPKQLTAEAAAKLAQLENAKREVDAYISEVVEMDESGNPVGFRDMAARLPANQRRFGSGVRGKLRAESGATITKEEEEGEMERYGPKLFSSDATNAQAALRMREDLDNQIRALTGGGAAPASPAAAPAQASSEPRAVNPQTGEVVVFRNGQWVPE